jgi:hypothetical protein
LAGSLPPLVEELVVRGSSFALRVTIPDEIRSWRSEDSRERYDLGERDMEDEMCEETNALSGKGKRLIKAEF